MKVARDISDLPTFAFGPRTLTWWGTLGFMALEGTGFVLAVGSYLYLMTLEFRAGQARKDAWSRFADRLGIDDRVGHLIRLLRDQPTPDGVTLGPEILTLVVEPLGVTVDHDAK